MEKKNSVTKEAFAQELCELVSEAAGKEYRIEQESTEKNNGVVREILLISRESSEYSLSFYLDELYLSYCKGIPVEVLSENIVEVIREENKEEIQIKEFLSKEWLLENMFLRLVNLKKNQEQLKEAVYIQRLDLAAVFYVLTEQGEDGIKSFRLPKVLWERLELGSAEEYFGQVLENTERLFPAEVKRIEDSLAECIQKNGGTEPEWLRAERQEKKEEEHAPLFYVLSNEMKINGAATLLYPGLLEGLEERFGGGFYLIPSSVHELLLLAESKETEVKELNEMVCEVNESHVIPEEVLSDHVYYYSKSCGLCSRG